jgi:hypothetical protein
MTFLTLDSAKQAAQEIILEFGEDYVYEKDELGFCHYMRDGQPSCLVGRIFHRLGFPLDILVELEGVGPGTMFYRDGWEAGNGVISFLTDLQINQDAGRPWGEAYRKACNGEF